MSTTTMNGTPMRRGLAPVIQLPVPYALRAGSRPAGSRPVVVSDASAQLRQWGGEISGVEVAAGPWRLTRRGRIAAVFAALLVALVVLSIVQVAGASTSTSANRVILVAAQQQSDTVVVKSGDTLWSIAAREMPNRDPREAVVALREANGIAGGEITAGQRLQLPHN